MELTTGQWIAIALILVGIIWMAWELKHAHMTDEFGQPINKPKNKKKR